VTLPEAVALIVAAFEHRETRTGAPKFYDVDRCDLISGNAARTAWRRRELTLYRIGKRLLVDADDLHTWIKAHAAPPPMLTTPETADDVDAALAAGGVRRAG
jgi:hypothetical protein